MTGASRPFDRTRDGALLRDLTGHGVYIGTSSWKYPGWSGQLYTHERYLTRGAFSNAKFEASCLSEYAEVFPTVCVDAAYYRFPSERYLRSLTDRTPPGFLFALKATDTVTIKHYPQLARFGDLAGKPNPNFLNADLFANEFLVPCNVVRDRIGLIIFEFSRFYPRDFQRGRDFVDALDTYLSALPRGPWQYAVEIRNETFLAPEYFQTLSRHHVAHVFNAWTKMPPVEMQLAMEGAVTTDFIAARFLLAGGRTYSRAVEEFSPYDETKAPDPAAREAARRLVALAKTASKRHSFLFVNNRLEGNALNTIAAVLE